MSMQGHCLHVRRTPGKRPDQLLAGLGIPCAVLGSNRTWVSFLPLADAQLDDAQVAGRLGSTVLHVWFDEDSAVTLRFRSPDAWQGELSVPLDGSQDPGREDERLLRELAARKVLSRAVVGDLLGRLKALPGDRASWLRAHGIEATLGLPWVVPLPEPCSEDLLRLLAPGARVLAAGAMSTAPTLAREPARPVASPRNWTDAERAVADLHFFYLTRLWSLNDWKLYHRYKKHLPAERRAEVDQLVNRMMTGAPEADLRGALEAILATVWEAEDWGAIIRDPRLLRNELLDPGRLQEWHARLAAVARAGEGSARSK